MDIGNAINKTLGCSLTGGSFFKAGRLSFVERRVKPNEATASLVKPVEQKKKHQLVLSEFSKRLFENSEKTR